MKGTRHTDQSIPGFLTETTLNKACFMFILTCLWPSFKGRKGGIFIYMTQERHEYIKATIQDALWKAFKQTGEPIFQEVYNSWFENFHSIDITNIE